MFKITKVKVAYITMSIIFIIFQIIINQNKINIGNITNIMEEKNIQIPITKIEENSDNWEIEIPKIQLKAKIKEGTSKEILEEYVGHFENTQKENGNIGLAGHNRGYKNNYFQKLKQLQKGDEIRYKYKECEKIYEVEKCRIIKDTDWDYLENTEENRLTLITCVENQPEYRRCVQAVEKEEVKH